MQKYKKHKIKKQIMKKSIFIIALIIAGTLGVQAQDSEMQKDALKLTKISSTQSVEANMAQIYTMIPEDNLESFKKELNPIMESFYKKIADKSAELYTHDEIKELIEFYESDLGQKKLEVDAELSKAQMQMAQEMQMKLMPLVQKYSQQ